MKIDLRKIKRSGKDYEELDFSLDLKEDVLDFEGAKIENPIKVTGQVTLTGEHSVLLDLSVDFVVVGKCARCLEDAKAVCSAEIVDDISMDGDLNYAVINDTVELDKIIEDAVILNAPTVLYCKQECKGICPGCGENLNYGQCKCKKQ